MHAAKNHIISDYLGFSHFTTSQLEEPRFSYFNAILAIRAAHKIKMFTWGFFLKVVIQVFPHKIKNPVLGKSISTVEKDYIHGSVSVIGGPGRGISTVGRAYP